MLALQYKGLQARASGEQYSCGRSSTFGGVPRKNASKLQSKYTPRTAACRLIVVHSQQQRTTVVDPESLQHHSDESKYKYVRQTGSGSWGYVVTIPSNIRSDADTRPKVRLSKSGFRTPEAAARAADLLHLAMFDPATHPKLRQCLNYPAESYPAAAIQEYQQLLRSKFGDGLKLRNPNIKCLLHLHPDRKQLLSTIKRVAQNANSSGLYRSHTRYVGAALIGVSKRPQDSEAQYRTSLQVGGITWSLQTPMTYLEAVVAHDLARVATFGEGHSAFTGSQYTAADIELMRKDIQHTAPGLLEAAAARVRRRAVIGIESTVNRRAERRSTRK